MARKGGFKDVQFNSAGMEALRSFGQQQVGPILLPGETVPKPTYEEVSGGELRATVKFPDGREVSAIFPAGCWIWAPASTN
jgi:hypothetical protein